MKAKIKEAVKNYMKEGKKVELQTLRSVLASLQYEEMQKSVEELNEADTLAILKNEIKKRKEAQEFEEKAGRNEQIETLNVEIACLEKFLPTQLSAEQIEKILVDLKSSDASINMGLAMKVLKEKYAGQYDGKLASDLAKKIFA